MELEKQLIFFINDCYCLFRTLLPKDVKQSYIMALKDQKRFLTDNPENIDIKWQQNYIQNILSSSYDTICGLFINSELIGTAGIQNIKKDEIAPIGIFVLDEKSRGKGYGKALVWASCYLSNNCCSVNYFRAGMKKNNAPSLKSFLACGFKVLYKNEKIIKVGLEIDELQKPEFIDKIIIK